jgi:hypothetical protein
MIHQRCDKFNLLFFVFFLFMSVHFVFDGKKKVNDKNVDIHSLNTDKYLECSQWIFNACIYSL